MHCTATLVISGVIKIMVVEINFFKKKIFELFLAAISSILFTYLT